VRALDDYIAEETGHEEWILSDIAAAGGNADGARHSQPAAATHAMVQHAYDQIATGNPVCFFGMVYVLESVSVALAQRGANALADRLALPPEAFTYLTSHGALDQDHMRFFADLVDALPGRRTGRPSSPWHGRCSACLPASLARSIWKRRMNRLDGKRIVLTGGAGGIGLPLARLLDDLGAHVTNVDRLPAPWPMPTGWTDLGDDIALTQLAKTLHGHAPDILINLAGVLAFGLHATVPAAACPVLQDQSARAAVLAQAVSEPMASRGAGQIVNVGSALGAIPYPWFAAYSSSKAGLAAFSQALRREMAGSGVIVTHVAPGSAHRLQQHRRSIAL
jgi:NADP-dependent 3-hydroxy acid dehydrogenase YdfG